MEICPKIIYPGHGPTIEDPVPKLEYYINHRNQRENQILEVMNMKTQKLFTTMELVKDIYKVSEIATIMMLRITIQYQVCVSIVSFSL